MFIMLKNSCTHLLFYCVSCLILSYFVLSIFIKLWEVPGRSHVDLDFSRSTCDLFAQHANAQSHKFNMAKRRTTTTWANTFLLSCGKYPEGHMLISIFRDQHVTCLPNTPMRKVTSSTWLNDVQPPHGHTQG